MNKAVFFDRDGVINPEVFNPDTGMCEAPQNVRDFAIYPQVLKSLIMLRRAGFKIFIVSNQPDHAKGKAKLEDIEAIAERLWKFSEDNGSLFDGCFYCHHHPDGVVAEYAIKCDCRKPGTLFLERAVERHGLDAARCYMVGDRATDIICGKKMGFTTIQINNERTGGNACGCEPDAVAGDIYEAACEILRLETLRKGVGKMDKGAYIDTYLEETSNIVASIDRGDIAAVMTLLEGVKAGGGRLFILGVGGSAANASHAVNDFRKIAGIEAYAPTDNVSELTARTNDDGWDTVFCEWLKTSHLEPADALLILSVGGGAEGVSPNLVKAIDFARQQGAKVAGIVSRDGGYTRKNADACVLIPVVSDKRITPHAEGWQGVVWHLVANGI